MGQKLEGAIFLRMSTFWGFWLQDIHIQLLTQLPFLLPLIVSPEKCEPPDDIPNGNISYTNDDPSNTLVGDAITYSCEAGTELQGPAIRVCLKTGNWSSDQPECLGKSVIWTQVKCLN